MKTIKKSINVSEAIPNTCLEVEIKGIKIFRIRIFLGANLLKLAAWVIGCKINLKING